MRKVILPEGKLFEIEVIYNNIENFILLLHAVDEKQAYRYTYITYGDKPKFSILEFKEILDADDVSSRTEGVEDIRFEKWWNPETTQVVEWKEIL